MDIFSQSSEWEELSQRSVQNSKERILNQLEGDMSQAWLEYAKPFMYYDVSKPCIKSEGAKNTQNGPKNRNIHCSVHPA